MRIEPSRMYLLAVVAGVTVAGVGTYGILFGTVSCLAMGLCETPLWISGSVIVFLGGITWAAAFGVLWLWSKLERATRA